MLRFIAIALVVYLASVAAKPGRYCSEKLKCGDNECCFPIPVDQIIEMHKKFCSHNHTGHGNHGNYGNYGNHSNHGNYGHHEEAGEKVARPTGEPRKFEHIKIGVCQPLGQENGFCFKDCGCRGGQTCIANENEEKGRGHFRMPVNGTCGV